MNKKFIIIGLIMLLLVPTQSIMAAEIFEYQTDASYVRIKYNDGTYGNIPINTTNYVIEDWPDYHEYEYNIGGDVVYNESMKNGVRMGAFFENEATVAPNDGESVTCTYTMYTTRYFPPGGAYQPVDTVPLIQYYINLKATDIMNGVQEAYYRSPVNWSDEFNSYYINIWDSDDNLVFTGEINESNKYGQSASHIGFIEDNRIFFKLNFKLYSENRYRIVEGSTTVDKNPITSFNVSFASQQDIGDDDEIDSYMFPGTPQARKYEGLELSWSMVHIVGIGLAGTEKLIDLSSLDDDADYIEVISQRINGTMLDVDYINVTVPFRFTEKTDMEVVLLTYGNASNTSSADVSLTYEFYNVTGIFRATIPVTDDDAAVANSYRLYFRFMNTTLDNHYVMYTMIPTTGQYHSVRAVNSGSASAMIAMPHFAMHIEIEEGDTGLTYEDISINDEQVLVGYMEILAGAFFILAGVLLAPTGIGVPLIAIGVGIAAAGVYHVYSGTYNVDPLAPMSDFLRSVVQGSIQGLKAIYDGLKWVGQSLMDLWVYVTTALPSFLNTLYEYFEIFLDLLYFIGFLVVIWVWAKFLKIMDGIVLGDIDGALSTTRTVINKSTSQARKGIRLGKKVGSTITGVGKSSVKTGSRVRKFIAPLMPPMLNRKKEAPPERVESPKVDLIKLKTEKEVLKSEESKLKSLLKEGLSENKKTIEIENALDANLNKQKALDDKYKNLQKEIKKADDAVKESKAKAKEDNKLKADLKELIEEKGDDN